MMTKYRIMLQGEDGMLWCEENNIPGRDIEENITRVKEQYPCAEIWTEKEETGLCYE